MMNPEYASLFPHITIYQQWFFAAILLAGPRVSSETTTRHNLQTNMIKYMYHMIWVETCSLSLSELRKECFVNLALRPVLKQTQQLC